MDVTPIIGTDGKVHQVPTDQMDRHFHGSDGRLVTDAEWDEMQSRQADPIQFNSDDFRVEADS